jgi:hypothetical protein
MKYSGFILFISLGLVACSHRNTTNETDPRLEAFHAFIRKFPVLKLPVEIRDDQPVEKEKPELDYQGKDTLFAPGATYGYGILPDTSRYYGVIVLFPADVLVPYIYTFTKSGRLISSERFFVGGCGPGPEVVYCSSSGTLDKNLNIYCADTLQWQDINSSGKAIPGTSGTQVQYFKGRISKTGKIIIGKETQIAIDKNIKE